MEKAFKARCPKPSLVGSRQLSVSYKGRWVEFLRVVGVGGSKSFKVRGETYRVLVERSSWLDALNLH